MKESNWQIEHNCPQCGAPVILDAADRILLCPYCRTKLYLVPGDHFRYYIPPLDPVSAITIFIPYWRMKGLSYTVEGSAVSHRFVDTNMLAMNWRGIPLSLGLRPQVFKLKFVSPETSGKFIDAPPPTRESIISAVTVISSVSEQIFASSGPVALPPSPPRFYTAFLGEMVSMIYSPLYVENNTLFDSFLKRPVCALQTADMGGLLASARPQNWKIQFISTLCPQCGWNLDGEKDALIMICRNCSTAWSCQGNSFKKTNFAVLKGVGKISQYLPFWKMKARIEGLKLDSYADLIRAGNLPKAVTSAFEGKPLFFWSPAFKVNPALFLRWARQMTIYQPEGNTDSELSKISLYPVNLDISEAEECIKITIADIVSDKRKIFPTLPQMHITLDDFQLVYHPFIESHNELIHESMRLSFDKKSLAFGSNL
ncbi:MAG: hypothetical protein ABFD82_07940 [Syntrophaceae bacterium]